MIKPKIRFKGFEGEWETSAIGDLASFSKGRGYSKSDLKNNGYPIILYGRMYTDYSFVIDSVDTFATLQKGSVLSNGDEVVIPASGETPEDIAVASAVTMKNVILGGDLNILKFDKNKIFSTFAAMQISCGRTRKELSSFAQGKTVVHLHNSNISKGHFCYPPISEQQSIASFFTTIDAQISASTSRLASLKQIKAASLQTMFPQEGETVPKLRFKGFEGEWKEITIGKITTVKRGVRITRKDLSNLGTYPVYQNTDYPMGYYNHFNVAANNPFVIIGGSAGLIGFSESDFWAADDCAYFEDNENIDKKFLYALLLHRSRYINKNVRGSSVPRLDRQVLTDLNVYLPHLQEQRAIASYFTNLDRQITLQTNRLEKLKQIKAACLDKMFV